MVNPCWLTSVPPAAPSSSGRAGLTTLRAGLRGDRAVFGVKPAGPANGHLRAGGRVVSGADRRATSGRSRPRARRPAALWRSRSVAPDRAWLEALDHGLKLRPEERPATVDAWRAALEHTRGARNSTIATMPQRFRKRIASAAIAATKRTAAIARDQRLAVRAMQLPRHALPIAAGIAGAVCLAALLSPTAPTLTADGSHATRSIAAGANTRPRTASIQPRHQQLARAPSRRPAAASAPSTSPGARVGNATAAGRRVPAPPAPRESSSPPVTASPAAAASPPVAASPAVAASPPGSPPGARVGDTTVIGWRVVDPQAPRPAPSPRPTTAPPPPAPSSPPTEPVRVGGNISPPTRTRNVRPVYPPHARSARVEGSVILEAVIGPTGRVTDVKVLRSAPLLDEAAMEAVLQWELHPHPAQWRARPGHHDGDRELHVVAKVSHYRSSQSIPVCR